jgi:hypothetical protein
VWLALPAAATMLVADAASAQWRVVQPQSQQQQSTRYDDMDTNGDGVITRTEWRGTRQAFNDADINRDGVLSGTEVQYDEQAVGTAGTTVRDRRSRFFALDENSDGIVSRNEWDGTRAQFNQIDANRDGVLTQREYVGTTANDTAAPRETSAGPQMVYVDARTEWTDTGIYVNQGDIIMLNAQGSVQMSDDGNDVAAPAGSRNGRLAANAPLPQDLAGALIGRIGNSAPFGVGNLRQITAPATGQLFLGVNDDHLGDNRGGYRVRVNVR